MFTDTPASAGVPFSPRFPHIYPMNKTQKFIYTCLILGLLALVMCFPFLLEYGLPIAIMHNGQETTIAAEPPTETVTATEPPTETQIPTEADTVTAVIETTAPTEAPITEAATTEPPVPWMLIEEGRNVTAAQYFVYDLDRDKFLTISGDPGTRVYQASITKLFTAYVAMQYLKLDTVITVGDALELVALDSSLAGLKEGDQIKVRHLIEGMMLPSGNDAACVLAVACGRTLAGDANLPPQEAAVQFIAEMNSMAKRQGLSGTHFVTPDGIHDENHYTTLADLVALGKLALNSNTMRQYAQKAKDTVTLENGTQLTWKNSNMLIQPGSAYYCPQAIGLKTGYTDAAGNCLLSAFRYEGKNLLIGVFGSTTRNDRFVDTLQLFNETMDIPYAEPTEPPTEAPTEAPTEG